MARRPLALVQLDRTGRPVKALRLAEVNRGTDPQPVVCLRCSSGAPAIPSSVGTCDRCLATVWMAPSTLDVVAQMRAPTILCLECLLEVFKDDSLP